MKDVEDMMCVCVCVCAHTLTLCCHLALDYNGTEFLLYTYLHSN